MTATNFPTFKKKEVKDLSEKQVCALKKKIHAWQVGLNSVNVKTNGKKVKNSRTPSKTRKYQRAS